MQAQQLCLPSVSGLPPSEEGGGVIAERPKWCLVMWPQIPGTVLHLIGKCINNSKKCFSLIRGNVRSLANNMGRLGALTKAPREYQECSNMLFAERQLQGHIPDSNTVSDRAVSEGSSVSHIDLSVMVHPVSRLCSWYFRKALGTCGAYVVGVSHCHTYSLARSATVHLCL